MLDCYLAVISNSRREDRKNIYVLVIFSLFQHQAFSYIKQIMTSEKFSIPEKMAVEKEAMLHIEELVDIDSRKTASLVLVSFSASLSEIVKKLRGDEKVLYDFLQGVFENRSD